MNAKSLIESVLDDGKLPADLIRDMCYGTTNWKPFSVHYHGSVLTEDIGGDVSIADNPGEGDPTRQVTDPVEADDTICIVLDSPEDEADYRELIAALKSAAVEFDLSNTDDGLELSWPESDQDTLNNILLGLGYETDEDSPETPEETTDTYREPA